MGGATLAAALAPSGRQVVVLERGPYLRDTSHARDATAIFRDGHYLPDETWLTPDGERFCPGNYANVGGNSKFYGAALLRYRAQDFAPIAHMGGRSIGWPFSYATLEPYYQRAEILYQVRGALGDDPTEPPHSGAYPYPPVRHEPDIADLARRLKRAGLSPAPLPLGVDLDRWLDRGQTPWDAFPDTTGAKMDAESAALSVALRHKNVTLKTGVTVHRVDAMGQCATSVITSQGRFQARHIIIAAGAVQTAAMLLRSATQDAPNGLANSSGQVGRNFMAHNASAILALSGRRNRSVYQKTLQINDWYLTGGPGGAPLGNIQLLGRVTGDILAPQINAPLWVARAIANRAIGFYAMSEDLPNPNSRVTLRGDDIVLDWKRSNMAAHRALVAKFKSALRRAGFALVLARAFDRRTPSHQCGTARLGDDPTRSVTNPFGRCHDFDNLYICDASLLPSSAAVNPSLTIAALALRQADYILQRNMA